MIKTNTFAVLSGLLLCLSAEASPSASTPSPSTNKLSLTPMTVYDDRTYPELIEPPRMLNQLNRDALQATEMPDINSVLRSQSGLMLTQC